MTYLERLKKVLDRTGYGRSTLYQQVADGLFPPPVHLGKRTAGWISSEVDDVLAARIQGKDEEEIRVLVRTLVNTRHDSFPCSNCSSRD